MGQDSCFYCGKKPEKILDERQVCNGCFINHAEKKIKKHLREHKFSKGENVLIIGELAGFVFKKIIKGLPLNITILDTLPQHIGDYDAIIVAETQDDECCEFLDEIIFGKTRKKERNTIKLFIPLTDKEVSLYAKLINKEFKIKKKSKEAYEVLKKLISFTPHIRNNLLKSKKELSQCVSKEKS